MKTVKIFLNAAKATFINNIVLGGAIALMLIMLTGCGSGSANPFGDGGDQTISIVTTQEQTNTQGQSTGTESCKESCQVDASSGDIVRVRECEGSPLLILAAFASSAECRQQLQSEVDAGTARLVEG